MSRCVYDCRQSVYTCRVACLFTSIVKPVLIGYHLCLLLLWICQTQTVTCNAGYTGGGTATCGTSGTFDSLTCTANVCTPTQVSYSNFADANCLTGTTGQVSYSMPAFMSVSCAFWCLPDVFTNVDGIRTSVLLLVGFSL
jgi:hypothetical protein